MNLNRPQISNTNTLIWFENKVKLGNYWFWYRYKYVREVLIDLIYWLIVDLFNRLIRNFALALTMNRNRCSLKMRGDCVVMGW